MELSIGQNSSTFESVKCVQCGVSDGLFIFCANFPCCQYSGNPWKSRTLTTIRSIIGCEQYSDSIMCTELSAENESFSKYMPEIVFHRVDNYVAKFDEFCSRLCISQGCSHRYILDDLSDGSSPFESIISASQVGGETYDCRDESGHLSEICPKMCIFIPGVSIVNTGIFNITEACNNRAMCSQSGSNYNLGAYANVYKKLSRIDSIVSPSHRMRGSVSQVNANMSIPAKSTFTYILDAKEQNEPLIQDSANSGAHHLPFGSINPCFDSFSCYDSVVHVFYCNANNLKNKHCTLLSLCFMNDWDAVCVSETHYNINSDILTIPGYMCFHAKNLRGLAGVSLWIKDKLCPYTLETPSGNSTAGNYVWAGFGNSIEKFAICCFYATQEGSAYREETNDLLYDNLYVDICYLEAAGYKIIIGCDGNGHIGGLPDGLRCNRNRSANKNGRLLLNFVESTGLNIANKQDFVTGCYTWERPSLSQKTVVDYFLFNDRCNVNSLYIDDAEYKFQLSDHNPLVLSVTVNRYQPPYMHNGVSIKWNRKISLESAESYNRCILNQLAVSGHYGATAYSAIIGAIKRAGAHFFGIRGDPTGGTIKTEEMRVLQRQLRVLKCDFKLLRHSLTGEEKFCYLANLADLRKKIHALNHRTRCTTSEVLVSKIVKNKFNHNMNLYKFMRIVNGSPPENVILKSEDGHLLFNPDHIKAALCGFWNNIYMERQWTFQDPSIDHPGLYAIDARLFQLARPQRDALTDDVTMEEIIESLKSVKSNTSSGYSDIPPEWIKNLSLEVINVIRELFQSWWESGILPNESQISLVYLLHKSGRKDLIENFRSLSLGCNLCKLFSRIMYLRLLKFVERADILGETQNGFRPNRRAIDNLFILKTMFDQSNLPGHSKHIFCASLDLKKAFDRVWRPALWEKLVKWSIPTKFVSILQALYRNPRGIVCWQNLRMELLDMPVGLKQGCVLSPLLFAIYIAELPCIVSTECTGVQLGNVEVSLLSYADDLLFTAKNKKDLQKMLRVMGLYGQRWHLEISSDKCTVISKGVPQTESWVIDISPGDIRHTIAEGNSFKYLGLKCCRNADVFKLHKKDLLNKIQQYKWLTMVPGKRLNRTAFFTNKIWKIYAEPSVLYGTEIMHFSHEFFKKLNVAHRQTLRSFLDFPTCTPNASVYAECDTWSMESEIKTRQLRYASYLNELSESRIVKQAHIVQKTTVAQQTGGWYNTIRDFAQLLQMEDPFEISKTSLNQVFYDHRVRELAHAQSRVSALRFYQDKLEPGISFETTEGSGSSWWLRARVGGLLLGDRTDPTGHCPTCGAEGPETLEHLLFECDFTNIVNMQQFLSLDIQHAALYDKCKFLLAADRPYAQRERIGRKVQEIWQLRNNYLSGS